ncbi:MAG TPA: SRPBCC family protein [Thermoleophilaceae bacterium]
MGSVRKQILIDARPEDAWDAIRDFGAVHERVVPGFVVDTRMDGCDRIVTFASGHVQREPLLDLDDDLRRLAYSAVDSPIGATHYQGSVQVFGEPDGRARVEWLVDFLPDQLRDVLDEIMDRGAAVMRETLSATPAGRPATRA